MKRLMAAALILSAIGALGVWFGLPVYAENQFRQSLDAWAASRPGDRAGYAVAKLDYWTGRATVGSMTEVVELQAGSTTVVLAVTLNDILIEEYDFRAAGRAIQGQADPADRIAGRVSWQSVAFENEARTLKGSGGAGSIANFAAARIDPLTPLNADGISFSLYEQAPVQASMAEGGDSLTVKAGPFRVSEYSSSGFSEFAAGALEVGFAGKNDQAASLSWESMTARGLARGEPTELAMAENLGFRFRFDMPAGSTDTHADGNFPGAPTRGTFGWDVYRIEAARFDEQVIDLYRDMIGLLARPDPQGSNEDIAALAEKAVQVLERADALGTGARRTLVENMFADIGGIQEMAIDRMVASDLVGLKFGRMETAGQRQTDALGNASSLDSSIMRDVDLTALPSYLRKVLGVPVTVESLAHAESFYRKNTIAAAIPALDFGVWEATGQKVRTPDGQEVSIERMSMESFRANDAGDVTLAFSFEGLGVDLAAVPQGETPESDMALAVLKSQGIEELKMDMRVAVAFSPSRGELAMQQVGIGVGGLASVYTRGVLGGLDVEQIRTMPPETRSSAIMSSVINQLEVELTDLGGRDIGFAMMGGQSGAKPEEMALALSLQANEVIGSLGSVRAEQIGQAVAGFVLSGGKLTLKASPEQPAPVVQLMLKAQSEGPAAVLELLKAEAEHQPPQ